MALLFGILDVYSWVIIIRALSSWISPDPRNPIVQVLYRLTEPVLGPLRKLVPPSVLGGLDISPILAIVLLQVVSRLLITMVI